MKKVDKLDKIEQVEAKILREEKKIEASEREIRGELLELPSSEVKGPFKIIDIYRNYLLRHLRKHPFVYTMLITFGAVLVWRGMWDLSAELPILKEAVVALVGGVVLLWILKKYTDLH